jgi:hypothetical protein
MPDIGTVPSFKSWMLVVRRAKGRMTSPGVQPAESGSTGALRQMIGDRGREHVKSSDG